VLLADTVETVGCVVVGRLSGNVEGLGDVVAGPAGELEALDDVSAGLPGWSGLP
jgi:hypothetical protein